jgi:hypothetical protein
MPQAHVLQGDAVCFRLLLTNDWQKCCIGWSQKISITEFIQMKQLNYTENGGLSPKQIILRIHLWRKILKLLFIILPYIKVNLEIPFLRLSRANVALHVIRDEA